MKKLIVLLVFVITVTLASCQSSTITCGEGLEMVEGVCVIKEDNNDKEEDKKETEESVNCDTTLTDYNASTYKEVWSDEFEYEGPLDETKWQYMIGNGGSYGIPGWGNNELQYYTNFEDNVNVEDGKLRITASTKGYAQYGYTSGRIRSMNLGDFKYGVIEVCAKLPSTLGTWPAIWMLPTDSPYGGWPTGGEIDIMEAVGFEVDTIHFNIHTENDNWGTSKSIGDHTRIDDIDSTYNAYAIKWTEDHIKFYVNGVEYFMYEPTNKTYRYWPFDTEFHLLLNIAVGGSWGGIRGVESGIWEDSMFVEYVRVYQEE